MPIARPTPPLLSAASVLSGLVTLVLALAGAPAAAQRVPAFDAAQPPVPQQDAKAQQLREQLRRVRLPAGFQIELYALVPGARHLAVSPAGDRVFVGTRRDTVWAVTDRDGDRQADEVRALAPGPSRSNKVLKSQHKPLTAGDNGIAICEVDS